MGIVKTNASSAGSGSGSGGANGADLPTRLKSISANGGNKFVTLTLGYENTDFVTGVQVNYKTGSYPTSPTDGQSMTVSGAATSIKVTGLTNKITYYFRVFLYREVDGVIYYQTDVTNSHVTCMPRPVEITGATPQISGTGYLAFTNSATFTLNAPAGTTITIGGGGQNGETPKTGYGVGAGGHGGYVYQFTLPNDVINATCRLTVGKSVNYNSSTSNLTETTLSIDSTTYKSSSGSTTVKFISEIPCYIGGDGGKGADPPSGQTATRTSAEDGVGAGGGGGAAATGDRIKSTISHGGNGSPYGGGGGGAASSWGSQYSKPGTGYNNGENSGWKFTCVIDTDEDYYCEYNVWGGAGGKGMSGSGGSKVTTIGEGAYYATYAGASDHQGDGPSNTYLPGSGGGGGYSGGGGGGGGGRGNGGSGGNGICVITWTP